MNDERLRSVPMILETPCPEEQRWAEEIELLYWMVDKKSGDPELLEREEKLQALGKEDREKQLESLKRKAEKASKVGTRKKRKKTKRPRRKVKPSSERALPNSTRD